MILDANSYELGRKFRIKYSQSSVDKNKSNEFNVLNRLLILIY